MSHPLNYTLQDLIGASLGCLLFIPILLAPGYVAAWFTNILGFRGLTSPWKLLVSLPLSVALCPIATFWTGLGIALLRGRNGVWPLILALYGIGFLVWLALLSGMWGHDRFPQWCRGFRTVPRSGWAIPSAWFLIAVASLVSLQFHGRLYLSFTDYDHELRAAITDAITRDGVRPFNPLYFVGSPAPLRYHYFWFLLCSMDSQLGGRLVSSQQAIVASVVWCGWSLIALVPLYLRFFCERAGGALRRCSLVAIGLFAVTGLDIVPTALYAATGYNALPEMEWWNEQVTSWYGSLLWVPHHVAALVAGLIGFLIAWSEGPAISLRRRVTIGAVAGCAFATAAGTSVYTTFVLAIFLVVWVSIAWVRHWRHSTAVLAIAGAVAALLALPYLLSLVGPASGGAFLNFAVRNFTPLTAATRTFDLDPFSTAYLRLLALPLNYFLELGFFGVVSVVVLLGLRKRGPLPANVVAAVTMAAVSVSVCTFVKSGTLNNDLGSRGFLWAQFTMLLWSADLMVRRGEEGKTFNSGWLRSAAWAPLILLGLAGTFYELVLLRTYFLWNDAGMTPHAIYAPDRQVGARTLELRWAYDRLSSITPLSARLQASPEEQYFDFSNGLYSRRQTVVADRACGTLFGGDVITCQPAYLGVAMIFHGAPVTGTWEQVEAICVSMSIDALVIDDLDGVWRDKSSWMWTVAPALSGRHVRVYLMGGMRHGAMRQSSPE